MKLSLEFKIGLVMALIPLMVGFLDFFVTCKSGQNSGEGCGFFLIIISIPFFYFAQAIGGMISYPLTFIFKSNLMWILNQTLGLIIIYFFIGFFITKIIRGLIINKSKQHGNFNQI